MWGDEDQFDFLSPQSGFCMIQANMYGFACVRADGSCHLRLQIAASLDELLLPQTHQLGVGHAHCAGDCALKASGAFVVVVVDVVLQYK